MEEERFRAFVAVRMSEEVEAAIAALIDELSSPSDGIKWTARANLHVTLKFLGPAVERARLAALAASLNALAAETAPFQLIARGAGAFPNLGRPRALWAGLQSAELAALAARVDDVAASAGFARETRRWSAHLTIGRI
ncbi:MAG TPA: RNA 2',3'-cyclic phosphodiesterase, partial [Candidatus Binataceae bacterium]